EGVGVLCVATGQGRGRRGVGKFQAVVCIARSAHPSSDRFAATFSLKGRRGTGTSGAEPWSGGCGGLYRAQTVACGPVSILIWDKFSILFDRIERVSGVRDP